MHKRIAILLSVILVLSLTACKKQEETLDNKPINTPVIENNQHDTDEPEDNYDWTLDIEPNDPDGETVRSEIPGYSYDENGLLIRDEVIGYDVDGNPLYDVSGTANFAGELYKDYSKDETNTEYSNRTLISGSEYNGDIDINAIDENWETLYSKIVNNPDDYIGKVIKVRGVSYNFRSNWQLRVTDGATMIDYEAGAYPNNGVTVEVIGTINKNQDGSGVYIDTVEVSSVY